jgi:hypothetical protein
LVSTSRSAVGGFPAWCRGQANQRRTHGPIAPSGKTLHSRTATRELRMVSVEPRFTSASLLLWRHPARSASPGCQSALKYGRSLWATRSGGSRYLDVHRRGPGPGRGRAPLSIARATRSATAAPCPRRPCRSGKPGPGCRAGGTPVSRHRTCSVQSPGGPERRGHRPNPRSRTLC